MRTDESHGAMVQPGVAALGDAWMDHLPPKIREDFVNARVRAGISEMPDDTPLTPELAALYLDLSDSTLKRMRANQTGPAYVQSAGVEGTKARNQKIFYMVGELKDWISKNTTASTGQAAVRRGLMFESITDLMMPEPWWMQGEEVAGHALSIDLGEAIDHLGLWDDQQPVDAWALHWMTVEEALRRVWLKSRLREPLDGLQEELFLKILRFNKKAALAGKERQMLQEQLDATFGDGEEELTPQMLQVLWDAYPEPDEANAMPDEANKNFKNKTKDKTGEKTKVKTNFKAKTDSKKSSGVLETRTDDQKEVARKQEGE